MSATNGNQAAYNLTNFTIREMSECGKAVRAMGENASSMEETTTRIVRHFYDGLVDGDGRRSSALIRFYKTHPFRELDSDLQDFAEGLLRGNTFPLDMKCLVLLATAGDKPKWNSRENSQGHKAIPLPSEEAIYQVPMVSNLIRQLGLPVGMVVRTDPELLLDMEQRTFNVFHVPEALGSPYIPAQQEFVVPCGIRSVLGFGGLFPSGEMFAVIMFFKVPISREAADLFKALSLSVKMAVLPFDRTGFSFKDKDKQKTIVAAASLPETDIQILHSRIAALEQLIEVYENSVVEQADKLYREIAERRQAGKDIRRLNEELEQKVEERTRQLLEIQEELVGKEKLAILGQLSGSVGHELRNPLGVMTNAVYFLKMVLTEADVTVQEYLGIIENEIDNSLRIITDLLDFARTRPPRTTEVTIRELTEKSLRRCAIPENIALQTEIPDNLPRLRVDPLQMEQVLINFLTNAVQAMPEGGTLRIAAQLVGAPPCGCPEAGGHGGPPLQDGVAISVTDSGEGITPENMGKLFHPLFTTKARGIGLGLVVCKNLVEANGGQIEVESVLGKGTTFTVTLPVEGTKS